MGSFVFFVWVRPTALQPVQEHLSRGGFLSSFSLFARTEKNGLSDRLVSRKPPIGYHLVKLEHELTSYVCKTCNRPYISATIIGEWREEDTWFKKNSLRLLSLPGCHDVANVRKQAVLKEYFTIKTIISISVT